jgi:hypothetical protein
LSAIFSAAGFSVAIFSGAAPRRGPALPDEEITRFDDGFAGAGVSSFIGAASATCSATTGSAATGSTTGATTGSSVTVSVAASSVDLAAAFFAGALVAAFFAAAFFGFSSSGGVADTRPSFSALRRTRSA